MEKEKKKIIVLATSNIFHKSGVKNFLKWLVKNCPKGIHYQDSVIIYSSQLLSKVIHAFQKSQSYTLSIYDCIKSDLTSLL